MPGTAVADDRAQADVVVVGLGAWGACAAWRLAESGLRVVAVERYTAGHALGASGGVSRMFRTACLEHPDLVPLAKRSVELWHELRRASGVELFSASGGLLIGPPDGHIIAGTRAAAARHDLAIETLSAAEVRSRYPVHAALGDDHIGVHEAGAGLLRPEAAIRAAVALAEHAGARVITDTRVVDLELTSDGVVAHLPAGTVRAAQAVVTAGGWLDSLVPGFPVETVRMPMTWFRPEDPEPFGLARMPVFMRQLDDGLCIWGHGAEAEGPYAGQVKLGLEDPGGAFPVIDPDTFDRAVGPQDWTVLAERLRTAVPGLGDTPSAVGVCMYTRTPDRQFIIGRPGADSRLVVAGGCNSHGFKHATGVGEAVAELVLNRPTTCPLEFADPDRFR